MEYLLLATITAGVAGTSMFFIMRSKNKFKSQKLKISQSRSDFIRSTYLEDNSYVGGFRSKTQATAFHEANSIRIVLTDKQAYWIDKNGDGLQVADLENGQINNESAKRVDTMSLSEVQLNEIMFIVDKLTKGNSDDHRSSGNELF